MQQNSPLQSQQFWSYDNAAMNSMRLELIDSLMSTNGIQVDTLSLLRAQTCPDVKPLPSLNAHDGLDSSALFSNLLSVLYFAVTDEKRQSLSEPKFILNLLEKIELSPLLSAYLVIEMATKGRSNFSLAIADRLRRIHKVLITDLEERPVRPSKKSDSIPLLSNEFGYLCANKPPSESQTLPGDTILFLGKANPFATEQNQPPIEFQLAKVEFEIAIATANHFVNWGMPPRSIQILDFKSKTTYERSIDPGAFAASMRSINDALQVASTAYSPYVPGPWCEICTSRKECPASPVMRVEENEDEEGS